MYLIYSIYQIRYATRDCAVGRMLKWNWNNRRMRMTMTKVACFISCATVRLKLHGQRREANIISWEKKTNIWSCLSADQITGCVHATFSLSEDRGQSTAGFWGRSIPQSQTASRRSPHLKHRSSRSWRRSTQPEGEDRYCCTSHNMSHC